MCSADQGLHKRALKGEGRGVELVVQQASDALAVVEDHRPVGDEEVVVLSAEDEPPFLGLVVDEILQRLPEASRAVNLVINSPRH